MDDDTTSRNPLSRTRDQVSRTFEITTRRPVAIFMVVLAVAVFGYISYQQLPLTLMPDISYPTLTIRTDYPDTAPEEVENLISRQIEQRLGVVNNLASIVSISRAGMSDVILEFGWDTDMNDAVQTVRENLDRLNMPRGVNKPLILRYDPTQDPIMRIGLYGDADLYALRLIAEEEIKQALEAMKGVAAARVHGGLEEEIRVEINERQLALMGFGIGDINRRLREENINLAGGSLLDGQTQYMVRTLNEFRTVDEIRDLVIGQKGGADIRLKDVSDVVRGHKDREIITRVNGVESVEIDIFKEADANIVATAQRVRDRLFGTPEQLAYVKRLKAGEIKRAEATDRAAQVRQFVKLKEMTSFIAYSLPSGMQVEVLSDQSQFIKRSIDEVKQTAIIGGILAILVLYVFLRNPSHTGIVSLAIPISIVATFAPMKIFGVSLNIMSLGGMALGIGMLVDNSIVVLESIFRCREEGDDIVTAAVRGTGEVGGAVFASTLTTVAVFFPIVFVEGVAGQVFGDMSLTVVFSLVASLAVALFFIPMLASRQIRIAGSGGAGSTIGDMFNSELLQFSSLARLKELAEDRSPKRLPALALRGLVYVLWLVFEFIWRTLWVALAILIVVLKAALVILAPILYYPFAALVLKIGRKPAHAWRDICAWSGNPTPFGSRIVQAIWHDLLAYNAPVPLGEGFAGCFRWTWNAVRRTCRWPMRNRGLATIPRFPAAGGGVLLLCSLFVLGPVYVVVRFFIFQSLSLLGKLLILLLMMTFPLGLTVVSLLAAVAVPLLTPVIHAFEVGFGAISRVYPSTIRWALNNRLAIVVMAILPFVFCWYVLVPHIGRELIPAVHHGEFDLELAMPVGTPLERTQETVADVESRVLDESGVARIATIVGVDKTSVSTSDQGEHTSRVTIVVSDETTNGAGGAGPFWRDLPERVWAGISGNTFLARREADLMARLRDSLGDLPQVTVDFSRPAMFTFKTPVELEIRGYDLDDLAKLGRNVELALSGISGLYDVKSSLQRGSPEVQIVYRRDLLASYGLNLRSVATLVREKVQGDVVTRFREADRRIDVLVRVDESDRSGVSDLKRLVVNPEGEAPIYLSAVADIQVREGPSEIRRIDQQRAVLVSANVAGIDLGTATGLIQQALETVDIPADVSFVIGGQNREMQTSLQSLIFALCLAVFLVYIVMASQFESFVHPFVIIFTIPLALIGVLFTLYVTGISFSVVVFLGLIMLAGIVVNNAIVFVDYINHLRANGRSRTDAIVQAGSVRLRPILMTTATTVLGLLPMALGLGEGSEIRTPMAITVVAGLISSTALTLIVIPTVYSLLDRGD
ncbi:MAG: efflux RND transporter permease subunit [Gemmatimonadota bacterium]|nr:efflux RND transporter permease subunit [Gemmatimonadota bacterium]